MRIVVGTDGSAASRVACDFVCGRTWPSGTRIRLIAAMEPQIDWTGLAPIPVDTNGTERERLGEALEERADALRTRGFAVEPLIEVGHPGDLLMAEAADWLADLIVVGNRGLGAAAAAVLGSVSSHLVDHSPCPVLVVRSPTASRMLIAADDTPSARRIPRILAAWGNAFRGLSVEVLSVSDREDRLPPGTEEPIPGDLELHRGIAAEVAGEMRELGWEAAADVRAGDPGREIVATGREWGADLIVTGSRGLGTLRRFVLGSVAHDVLLHARSSVLVMRGQVPARLGETAVVTNPAPA